MFGLILPQQIGKGFQLFIRIEMNGQFAFAAVVGHIDLTAQHLLEAFFHLYRQCAAGLRFLGLLCRHSAGCLQ